MLRKMVSLQFEKMLFWKLWIEWQIRNTCELEWIAEETELVNFN